MVHEVELGSRKWRRGVLVVAALMMVGVLLTSGCLFQAIRSRLNPSPGKSPTPVAAVPKPNSPADSPSGRGDTALFAGRWRVYSSRLYYDQGGGGAVGSTLSRDLELLANGTWKYGSSSGKWSLSAITAADWRRWGIESYSPTRKITLSGWNGGTADGPVEESAGRVDFIWVIYKAGPPTVGTPGTIWLKYGHP